MPEEAVRADADAWTYGERPVHVLGLIGFAPGEQEAILQSTSVATAGGIRWEIGPYTDADAWLASGWRTEVLGPDQLRIRHGDAGAVHLLLDEVDRPIAFSLPLAARHFEPACTFAADDTNSLLLVLAKFAFWLRPRAMQMYLVASFLRWRPFLKRARVFHVERAGKLLAVVDLQGECGVLPTATAAEFADAQWIARPDGAAYIPTPFTRARMRDLVWQYATRTHLQLLPRKFLRGRFYLRSAPSLPPKLLADSQLMVLRALYAGHSTISQLRAATGMGTTAIAHALGALWLVGAITGDTDDAWTPALDSIGPAHSDPTVNVRPSQFGPDAVRDMASRSAATSA